jgi:hypothetical protein
MVNHNAAYMTRNSYVKDMFTYNKEDIVNDTIGFFKSPTIAKTLSSGSLNTPFYVSGVVGQLLIDYCLMSSKQYFSYMQDDSKLTLPEHLRSPPVFSGVRVARSLVLYVCFVDRCLYFCTFSFGHCVVCSSSIYGFWLPLWYLQTLLNICLTKCYLWKLFNCTYCCFMCLLYLYSNKS